MGEVIDLASSGSSGGSLDQLPHNLPPNHPLNLYKVELMGEPKAWLRPKSHVKRGGFGNGCGNAMRKAGWYFKNTVDTNKLTKKNISDSATQQLRDSNQANEFPIYNREDTITMEMEFHRRIPNSEFTGAKRSNGLKASYRNGAINIPDNKKPDLDNLAKLIKDALEGVAHHDDKQVVVLHAYKMMDVQPPHNGRTIVWFRAFRDTDLPPPLDMEHRDELTAHYNGRRIVGIDLVQPTIL